MKVCFHELKNEIEVSAIIRFDDFVECDYVFVVELRQDCHLSIGALCIHIVLESIEYFF